LQIGLQLSLLTRLLYCLVVCFAGRFLLETRCPDWSQLSFEDGLSALVYFQMLFDAVFSIAAHNNKSVLPRLDPYFARSSRGDAAAALAVQLPIARQIAKNHQSCLRRSRGSWLGLGRYLRRRLRLGNCLILAAKHRQLQACK